MYFLDPSLVFPVPEDGSKELDSLVAGPEMDGWTKPKWPGFYIRFMPDTYEWVWNEFLEDGYWAAMGIFEHEIQNAIWRGAILKATEQMMNEIIQLREKNDSNQSG